MNIELSPHFNTAQSVSIEIFYEKFQSFLKRFREIIEGEAYWRGRLEEARDSWQAALRMISPYDRFNFAPDDDPSWLAEGEVIQERLVGHGHLDNSHIDWPNYLYDLQEAYEDAYNGHQDYLASKKSLSCLFKDFVQEIFDFVTSIIWVS